jgi:hypothetical protein
MTSVTVGVEGRQSAVGCRGEVSQSPRFRASVIGLRSLGFVGTLNVGSRAPACPLLLWRCARGGPLAYTAGAPDQGADRIGFPIRKSGDHFPNILLLDLHILSLLRQSVYSQISAYDTLHHDSQLRTIRHNDHNTPFCFKTDSCLGPFTSKIISFPSNPCRLSVL